MVSKLWLVYAFKIADMNFSIPPSFLMGHLYSLSPNTPDFQPMNAIFFNPRIRGVQTSHDKTSMNNFNYFFAPLIALGFHLNSLNPLNPSQWCQCLYGLLHCGGGVVHTKSQTDVQTYRLIDSNGWLKGDFKYFCIFILYDVPDWTS